jgi:hypothetical protein
MRLRAEPSAYWDKIRESIRAENKGKKPDPEAVAAMLTRLDAMLDHAVGNFELLDRKAIGILAGVAAVAAFLAGKLDIATFGVGIAGGLTLACSVLAAGCSVLVIHATAYSAGANAREIALATSADALQRDQGIVESLAAAVLRAEQVMEVKATWLNAALSMSVAAILSLAIFAALGGVK